MKTKCCRSTPRCAGCPVRALTPARKQRDVSEIAVLVNEVFAGRPAPALPACVAAALAELEDARSVRPSR